MDALHLGDDHAGSPVPAGDHAPDQEHLALQLPPVPVKDLRPQDDLHVPGLVLHGYERRAVIVLQFQQCRSILPTILLACCAASIIYKWRVGSVMTSLRLSSNWVYGDRFFNREAEIRALHQRVENGAHTLLTAQRRMGKTSLVRELLRRLDAEGQFTTVFVGLENEGITLENMLFTLEHDGYLEVQTEGYRFISGLLEDW